MRQSISPQYSLCIRLHPLLRNARHRSRRKDRDHQQRIFLQGMLGSLRLYLEYLDKILLVCSCNLSMLQRRQMSVDPLDKANIQYYPSSMRKSPQDNFDTKLLCQAKIDRQCTACSRSSRQ